MLRIRLESLYLFGDSFPTFPISFPTFFKSDIKHLGAPSPKYTRDSVLRPQRKGL